MTKHVRPGSYNTHFTLEDIYELRKLIKTGTAHKFTNAGKTVVIALCLPDIGFVVYTHTAEFKAVKCFIIPARSLLRKKYGSLGFKPDNETQQGHHPG